MDEIDSFNRIIRPIVASFVLEITPDFCTLLFVDFQHLLRLQNTRI